MTCIYNSERAQCRSETTDEGPDLRSCEPLSCRNVALTTDNTRSWNTEKARLEDEVSRAHLLPPYIGQKLRDRLKAVNELLETEEEGL